MKRSLKPANMVSPGQFLAELLDDREWTPTELAEIIERPVAEVEALLSGAERISPELALRLAAAFESSPPFFLNLEMNFQLWTAEKEQSAALAKIRKRVADLAHPRSA